MNLWQFLAGVVTGGVITTLGFWSTGVARRGHSWVKEDLIRPCHIDEEWEGYFIGRRHCFTHDVHWDGGGPCPATSPDPSRDGTRP